MKNKYTIKPTKKQLEVMRYYWNLLQEEYAMTMATVGHLERKMSEKSGIKDLEFFQVDGEFVGVGDCNRKMKLIQF